MRLHTGRIIQNFYIDILYIHKSETRLIRDWSIMHYFYKVSVLMTICLYERFGSFTSFFIVQNNIKSTSIKCS